MTLHTPSTPSNSCPDAEELGALLAGWLEGERKERVLAHLADCYDCAEVFADAARFQLDEAGDASESPREARILRHPRSWSWLTLGTLAAAACLTVLVSPAKVDTSVTGLLAATPLPANAPAADWYHQGLPTGHRGDSAATACDLGVRQAELHVALLVGDMPQAGQLADELQRRVAELQQSQLLQETYGYLGDSTRSREQALEASRSADAMLGERLPAPEYTFGKWWVAARLAAASHDAAFFRSPLTQKVVKDVPAEVPGSGPGLAAQLDAVMAAQPPDWAALDTTLGQLRCSPAS